MRSSDTNDASHLVLQYSAPCCACLPYFQLQVYWRGPHRCHDDRCQLAACMHAHRSAMPGPMNFMCHDCAELFAGSCTDGGLPGGGTAWHRLSSQGCTVANWVRVCCDLACVQACRPALIASTADTPSSQTRKADRSAFYMCVSRCLQARQA